MLTDEQRQNRQGKLGSSDAPVVAGLSPYKSPWQLYHELRGTLPRYSVEETRAQRMGSKLEPVIAELAAEELGATLIKGHSSINMAYPWMVAHIDFAIDGGANGLGLMEVKNRGAIKPWEEIPHDVALQVAHQFICTGYTWGIVAALFEYGTLETYAVRRDEELESYLIELERRFIDLVERGEEPAPTWTAEHVETLKRIYPKDSGNVVQIHDPLAPAAAFQFLRAKQAIKEAEALKTEAEGQLKSWMQDAASATMDGFSLSWKTTKGARKFDEDTFAKEHPELYARYQKEMPGHRRFLVKPGKEIIL